MSLGNGMRLCKKSNILIFHGDAAAFEHLVARVDAGVGIDSGHGAKVSFVLLHSTRLTPVNSVVMRIRGWILSIPASNVENSAILSNYYLENPGERVMRSLQA